MDGGAWWAAVHGVAKRRTRLSDFSFTFHFHALEKEMKTHSSVFAWRIPGTGEPGGLPSMGSHRVGHDWSDAAAAAAASQILLKSSDGNVSVLWFHGLIILGFKISWRYNSYPAHVQCFLCKVTKGLINRPTFLKRQNQFKLGRVLCAISIW